MRLVSRQDSFETVNQLKDLVANRTKAIDEQVMLNFAAASSKATRVPDRFDELPCSCFSSILAPCPNGRIIVAHITWFFLAVLHCLFAWSQLVVPFNTLEKVFHRLVG